MKSARPADLVRLLLRQSDRHPVRSLSATDLLPFDARFVRSLKNRGILKEREDLSDDGGTVLHVDGDGVVEIDPETGACERMGDPLDIQIWDIDFGAICRELREQSGLRGPGPRQLSPRIWRLGRHVRNDRGAEICLVRQLRPETAQEIIDHVRGAIDSEALVVIIGLSRCDLPTSVVRQLDGLRMTITAVDVHLGDTSEAPFSLDLGRVRLAPARATETRLSIDRIGRRAIFENFELSVEPRDFDVLALLAEEAAGAGGWVPRDSIAATLAAATGRDSQPEQVDRSINRLRDAFRKDDRLKDVPRSGFIEAKSKTGYRLTLSSAAIGFTA